MTTTTALRTATRVIPHHASAILVARGLIRRSQWFACEPLPDDRWEITVKEEYAASLDGILSNYNIVSVEQ